MLRADITTHPPIGSWVWGTQGVSYQVIARYHQDGQYWLTLATDSGPVEMPLDQVQGWDFSPPTQNSISQPSPPPPLKPKPLDIRQPWPGSIATPVNVRIVAVLQSTSPKAWDAQRLAKLPCMGGPTLDQVNKNLKLLKGKGLIEQSGLGKNAVFSWRDSA